MSAIRFRLAASAALIACLMPLGIARGALAASASDITSQIAQLNAKIAQYEAEIKQAGADKKTLQAAIDSLDLSRKKLESQVSLVQAQIAKTQGTIDDLDQQINETEAIVEQGQQGLAETIRAVAQADDDTLVLQLLSSGSLASAWSNFDADGSVEDAIRTQVDALEQQELTLATQKTQQERQQETLADQRSSLKSQQATLAQTEASKADLLTETEGKESKYEQLLASAQAELASFSKFAQNAGGSGIVGEQTVCDAWGCYYNQRDAAWGTMALDGTSYKLASDGCLVTAMAMVMTHYGYRDVTPITINSNPSNFASYAPAYLLNSIVVDGVTATRTTASIDATLAGGDPVIVGLHAYGGTHFVVLVSGSKGNYVMRDPYISNGKDISFSAHYSMDEIYEVGKVVIS
ncbi:MAG TPA: hypothetical protein VFL98_00765 [Candidatus Paceibacterota bacterium]|nr:hypothetical protein [Candidatus Paceibacterota bacterium]